MTVPVPDHAEAVRRCLEQLTDPESGCLSQASEVAAIGFKAVHDTSVDNLPDSYSGDAFTPEVSGIFSQTFADELADSIRDVVGL